MGKGRAAPEREPPPEAIAGLLRRVRLGLVSLRASILYCLEMRYRFIQDIQLSTVLHVVTVRSQRAWATLAGVEAPELPEGVTLLLGRDIPGSGFLEYRGRRMPILAGELLRYVGEPVALVAARDLGVAQAVASSVTLRYADASSSLAEPEGGSEVASFERGDSVSPLAGKGLPARELVTSPRRFAPPAPQEAIASFVGQTLTLRTATQHPFHVRATVAAALGLPPARVRVIAEPVDGAGGKLLMPSLVAAHAALVAAHTGSPARIRYSWREELGVAFRIAGTRTVWQAGIDPERGTAAARFQLTIEGGAYDLDSDEVARRSLRALSGPYRSAALHVEVSRRSEGTVPCELPPGCGDLEAVCARELCAEELARSAGMDPADWRLANLESDGGGDQGGRRGRSRPRNPMAEVLEEVARASDFHRKHAAYEAVRERRGGAHDGLPMRGVGISLATFRAGFGAAAEQGTRVRVSMGRDRRVTIQTSAADTGRGGHRMLVRIAAAELGLAPDHVSVAPVDTSIVPYSGPSAASRTAALLVPLLRKACAALRSRLRRVAPPCSAESASRVAEDREEPFSCAGTVAAVQVDPVTGAIRCTGIWTVIDAGDLLDPEPARAVAAAALVRGLGIALIEESEAAIVPVPPATDAYAAPAPAYRIARHSDFGLLSVSFLPKGAERGKLLSYGISELGALGVPPAVAAAVEQATGSPVSPLPIRDAEPAPRGGQA